MSFDGDERVTIIIKVHTRGVRILSKFKSVAVKRTSLSIKKYKKKKNIIEFSSADRTERCTHPLYSVQCTYYVT